MQTIIPPPVYAPPVPKFLIGEREPLTWLVSILFTEKFRQRNTLGRPIEGGLGFDTSKESEKSGYKDLPALYAAMESWIDSDPTAADCLAKAKQAIKSGELSYFQPPADRWGDRPFYVPERDIDSYQFLLWAERHGYILSKDVADASYLIVHSAIRRKNEQEQQVYLYPPITPQDFAQLRKQPLWEANNGLLYLLGRRCRVMGKEAGYTGDNGVLKELSGYFLEATNAKQLNIIFESGEPSILKITPNDLIAWAQALPIVLPMLNPMPESSNRPAHCTPDMALMYDAIAHFWKDYDLAKPNPNVAPMKKTVVAWLIQEAANRGITDFSKTRAEAIDTIIRCPEARKGGNSY